MSEMSAILEDLAAGRIDAAEAQRRIDRLNEPGAGFEPSDHDLAAESASGPSAAGPATGADNGYPRYAPPPPPKAFGPGARRSAAPGAKGVERLSLRATGRRIKIVGDPGVPTVSIDGPHTLRRNGVVLEITSEGSFRPQVSGLDMLRSRTLGDLRGVLAGKELVVRVNPALLVECEISSGGLTTEHVPYLGHVRVTAGATRIGGVSEIGDALFQAGRATVEGTITQGRSRIRGESCLLVVELGERSNVTVRSDAQLGKVSWSGGHTGAGDEVVMGNGNARLDVEVMMGHGTIRIGPQSV
ncbi:MAG: hypothetical protein L0G99_07175 [Propionibacteriales bacterium]|nr:hypothetical protein [Propionibacteriales bacterium]